MRIDEVFGYESIAEWTMRVTFVSVPFSASVDGDGKR